MTKEAKLQVERKVVEILGDLYGTYYQINKLDDKDVNWLKEFLDFDPLKKNLDHDAAGINDDWPVGRGVFISDDRDFFVFVNFEDHLKLVVLESLFND